MHPATDGDLQQWLEEARRGIEKPLTAGNLIDYQLCPRKFLLSAFAPASQRRALGAVRALQAAIRATLVACDRAGGPAAASLEWLRDEFRRRFDGRACADSLEEEQTLKLGLAMLARWQAEQREAKVHVLAADEVFQGKIEDIEFVATADRVERLEDGRLAVGRYDVRARPMSARKLAADFSMGLLVTLAEQRLGQRPVARIYALRVGRTVEAEMSDEAIEQIRRRALVVARNLRADGEFEPRAAEHCIWCRVRRRCPQWEARRRRLLTPGGQ